MAYVPPIGIPAPSFGIDEVAGSYTHYVDRTHPSATDTSNPNGSASTPRLTVPTTLEAGSVCEVHGTGYTLGTTTWTLNGTSGSPVFIKGVGAPTFTGSSTVLTIAGSYGIVEGLDIINQQIRFGVSGGAAATYMCLRASEARGWTNTNTSSMIGANVSSPVSHDLVLYDLEVHDNGVLGAGNDFHGVKWSGTGLYNCWYLDSLSYNNDGDTIQIGSASGTVEPWPEFLYIGRVTGHNDTENYCDFKQCRDVIVSEGVGYGYEQSVASGGVCGVVHNGTVRCWFLFNAFHSSRLGIQGTGQEALYVIGNVFYNLARVESDTAETSLGTGGNAVQVRGHTGDLLIVNNTVHDCTRGFYLESSAGSPQIINNIVHGLKGAGAMVGFDNTTVHTNATIEDNLFDTSATPCRVQISSTRHMTLAAYIAAHPTKGAGCLEGDPDFVNSGIRNYDINETSDAVGVAAADHAVYSTFNTTYGRSIQYDKDGLARPQGGSWDMGAYEYAAAQEGSGVNTAKKRRSVLLLDLPF